MLSPAQAARARQRTEERMQDLCEIGTETKSAKPNPATGKHDVVFAAVYSGRCEFVAANTAARVTTSAGRRVVEQGAVLKIPVGAPGSDAVLEGHIARITLTEHDSATIRAVVGGGHHQSFATARRLPVEVTT